MNISLDYDGTFTADPKMWTDFIAMSKVSGHNIFCITMRYPHEEISMPCEVFYTGRKAKRQWAIDHNVSVDIWIDDMPFYIYDDAA